MTSRRGMLYLFTGEGKGKTSAALGVAMRAVGAGMRVGWVAWYKQQDWDISEYQLPTLLSQDRFNMYLLGQGFYLGDAAEARKHGDGILVAPVGDDGQVVVDRADKDSHIQAAEAALEKAATLMPICDLLVMDEVHNAIGDGLVSVERVLEVVRSRNTTHVVLTGRNAPAVLVEEADLVTEMRKVKHPYDAGKLAVKGLDY